MRGSRLGRVAAAVGLAGGTVVAMALPASAHVTLHSYEAQQGGSDALIQIRTPNEESNATTTQLEVDFPVDTPLIGLYVEPTPGWQFQVTTSNLPKPVTNGDGTFTQYVSKVVWSGGNIPVGGYVDFNIDVSDLPNVPDHRGQGPSDLLQRRHRALDRPARPRHRRRRIRPRRWT